MKPKNEKATGLSSEHREALGRLSTHKDFKALERLFLIEEQNIVIHSFKINSSTPDLARLKAFDEGKIFELRKILKTFELVRRGEDEDGS